MRALLVSALALFLASCAAPDVLLATDVPFRVEGQLNADSRRVELEFPGDAPPGDRTRRVDVYTIRLQEGERVWIRAGSGDFLPYIEAKNDRVAAAGGRGRLRMAYDAAGTRGQSAETLLSFRGVWTVYVTSYRDAEATGDYTFWMSSTRGG